MSEITADQLAEIALFQTLARADREVLAKWLDKATASAGRQLTHQGATGYAFAFIASGSADVVVDGETVRTLGPGDFFGELSMLGDGRQTASVTVTSPSEIWTMFGTRFRQLQAAYPQIAAAIEEVARERLNGNSSDT